jgi:selenocysteine lyase/cysteine desulfurase
VAPTDPVWKELREDFPALKNHVYLNAAAASPTPRTVAEAVTCFYKEQEEGGDLQWDSWRERVEGVRAKVASFLGAEADEIAFVPNTSAGMNLIVDLIGGAGAVLSDEMEFPTVTLPWIHRGVQVHFVPAVEGVLRIESFSPEYAPRAATMAVSHVQFTNGCRQDLSAFGGIKAQRHFVVSASQSAGAFPIDVKASAVDALACAGHKWMCAGYGAGFLYVSRALLEKHPPRSVGWLSVEDPFSFENRHVRLLPSNRRVEVGCPSFGTIFALGAAIDYLSALGMDKIAERVLYLNEYLTFRLERRGIVVLSPGGPYRSSQTLCQVPRPSEAVAFLRERGILVSEKPEGVRVSTHFYNNEEDVDRLVEALTEYAKCAAAEPPDEGARESLDS